MCLPGKRDYLLHSVQVTDEKLNTDVLKDLKSSLKLTSWIAASVSWRILAILLTNVASHCIKPQIRIFLISAQAFQSHVTNVFCKLTFSQKRKKNRLNRWIHAKKHWNTSKVSLLYFLYRKKVKIMIFSVRSILFLIKSLNGYL